MRILEIETFGKGGLAHYVFNLSRALAERGHEVTLVTGAGFELGEMAVPPGLQIFEKTGRASRRWAESLPRFAGSGLRKVEAIYDALAVAVLARRIRPDILHLHCTNPIAPLILDALRIVGRPRVITAHDVTPHEPIPFQRAIFGHAHRVADLVVAHSEFDRSRLVQEQNVAPERVAVIPHGEYGFFAEGDERIDPETARRELGLSLRDEVVLFFGYIREYKGLDVLLEAWPAVAAARPAARLLIAGDPARLDPRRREELERWAERLDAVHRFGYIPFADVASYFAAADVLALPYRHISQSGVLYLALALGVPVVATRVGGLPELLRDGESALLVAPASPHELAQALSRALGDVGLRERVSASGRRLAQAHSWPAVAERSEEAFEGLIERYRDSS